MHLNRFLLTCLFIILSTAAVFSVGAVAKQQGPIHIYSDSELAEAGFPGDGSENNPYRISNRFIKSSTARISAVIIENTKSFILISGCKIVSEYVGIRIKNTAEGSVTIRNTVINSLSRTGSGISLINAKGCLVEDNTCSSFYIGLHLNTANENKIISNTITDSRSCGIDLVASSRNMITGNTIQDAPDGGISTEPYSKSNIIKSNRFLFE